MCILLCTLQNNSNPIQQQSPIGTNHEEEEAWIRCRQLGGYEQFQSLLCTLRGHSHDVSAVAYSPDGTKIVSGSGDKTVRVWDAVTGTLINTLQGHSEYVSAVAYSPDGTKIVSGSWDKTVRVWDAVTGSFV